MCSPGVHTAASLCLKGKERMSLKILRVLHKCADEIYFFLEFIYLPLAAKTKNHPAELDSMLHIKCSREACCLNFLQIQPS